MTVGLEIESLTGIRLFHNHLVIEPILRLFDFNTPPFVRIASGFRRLVFHEVAKSNMPGLTITFVWDLDSQDHKATVEEFADLFQAAGASVYYIELYASLEERIRRNRTELQLLEKPSKRDVVASEALLIRWYEAGTRHNTDRDFFWPDAHLKIDTTELSAVETAERIVETRALSDSHG